jgi:hypothetical protein
VDVAAAVVVVVDGGVAPSDDPQPARSRPPRRTVAKAATVVPVAGVLGRWVIGFTMISFLVRAVGVCAGT